MKILAIDDDIMIQRLLTTGLSSEGFAVTTVSNAMGGLQNVKEAVFDCIILDNMLPDISGMSLCEILRKENITTPIIGLSVQTNSIQKTDFINAGADDYMEKPFTFSELIARIRAITRRGKTILPEIFICEDVSFDIRSGKVTVNGAPLYLTVKESKLLEYMLAHRGMLLTRAMIYEHVWGMRVDPFSNSIEAHVRTLRKKLGASYRSGESIIKTIPGRGYMIE